MKATIDSVGRLMLPKALRDTLGLAPGSTVDISMYGAGVQIVPGGRTAQVEQGADGWLVAKSDTPVSDDDLFALIDADRR